jgi:hypothetical protein
MGRARLSHRPQTAIGVSALLRAATPTWHALVALRYRAFYSVEYNAISPPRLLDVIDGWSAGR